MIYMMSSVLGAWLFADFLSGIFHWAGDRILVRTENAFLNSLMEDNVLHHSKPAAMLRFSLFENVRVAICVMWPVSLVLYLLGAPVVVWLGFFFLALANGVHWFSHRRKVNPMIKAFQRIGFFASFDHHKAHHARENLLIDRADASEKYCVMTDWVNTVLDRIQFFRFLEAICGKEAPLST